MRIDAPGEWAPLVKSLEGRQIVHVGIEYHAATGLPAVISLTLDDGRDVCFGDVEDIWLHEDDLSDPVQHDVT